MPRRTASWLLVPACVVLLAGCRGIRPPHNATEIERTLVVTAYCKCGKCCDWKRTWYGKPVHAKGPNKGMRKKVGVTAAGRRARRGTIAADTRYYPFGTIMYVPGYGYGRVEDRGGAIKGERIDLFFDSHRRALGWGRQTVKVKIWLPTDG